MTATETTIYAGTAGATCYLDGMRGRTTGFTFATIGHYVTGAFVERMDTAEGGMYYAEFGGQREGDRYEVTAHRAIDRDEFDRLNGLDVLRAELGWK